MQKRVDARVQERVAQQPTAAEGAVAAAAEQQRRLQQNAVRALSGAINTLYGGIGTTQRFVTRAMEVDYKVRVWGPGTWSWKKAMRVGYVLLMWVRIVPFWAGLLQGLWAWLRACVTEGLSG